MSHRVVKHAAVIGRKERFGDATLVAYIVPHRRPAPPVSALRKFLEEKLPEYMIPSAFVILEALPMMSTGKVNRRALPEPTYERPNLVTPLVKPRTTVETTLAKIWAEVLSLDVIGIHDNFFDLGGHSLAASGVVSRVIQSFRVVMPLKELFDCPTIAEMARVIWRNLTKQAEQSELERMLGELESLSDGDAQRLLEGEIAPTRGGGR